MEEEQLGDKYLVCTAFDKVFPENGKIYYLGEWCKLFSKDKSPKINEVYTFGYHWDNKLKFNEDFEYLNSLYELVLLEISNFLNQHHKINKPLIYWRVLIGYWLGYAIQVLFDRYENLKKLKHEKFTSIFLKEKESFISPTSTENFAKLVTDDRWNSHLYYLILNNIDNNFKIKLFAENKIDFISNKTKNNSSKTLLLKKYQSLLNYLNNSNSPLIITSYLSKTNEFLLNFKFGSFPYFSNPFIETIFEPNLNYRKLKLNFKCKNEFENLAAYLLPKLIPTSFLEGYSDLASNINNFSWPSNPKFIYTSNSIFFDEKFKLYCAENKSKGVKLFIGQHGGSYGIAKKSFSENYQLSIADCFFSWGWNSINNSEKISDIGTISKFKKIKIKPSIVLMVTTALPRYSYHLFSSSKSSQFINYTENQFKFISNLNSLINNSLIVRLIKKDYGWEQIKRYRKKFPNLNIDSGETKMIDLLSKTKLYIGTYNATSYLEAIYLNIPTVIYWDINEWEIRDEAKPYFDDLKKVKVFFEDPKSAAMHVNEIYNNIGEWWNSKEVSKAVINFKNNFCREEKDIVNTLTKKIKCNL